MTQGAKDISRNPGDKGRLATWDARYIASRSENGPIRSNGEETIENERKEIKASTNGTHTLHPRLSRI